MALRLAAESLPLPSVPPPASHLVQDWLRPSASPMRPESIPRDAHKMHD
jgi:hypothetical protein